MKAFLLLALLAAPAAAQTRAAGQARVDAEFARTDHNHDGLVRRDELARRLARLRINGRAVTPAQTKMLADTWFARADRNRDGRISRDEAHALYREVFTRFDGNHDGRLDAAERATAKAVLSAGAR